LHRFLFAVFFETTRNLFQKEKMDEKEKLKKETIRGSILQRITMHCVKNKNFGSCETNVPEIVRKNCHWRNYAHCYYAQENVFLQNEMMYRSKKISFVGDAQKILPRVLRFSSSLHEPQTGRAFDLKDEVLQLNVEPHVDLAQLENIYGLDSYINALEENIVKSIQIDFLLGTLFTLKRILHVQGYEGCGKTFCTRTFCATYCISLIEIDARCNIPGLLKEAVEVAKKMQPCVIYIKNAERWLCENDSSGTNMAGELLHLLHSEKLFFSPRDLVWFVFATTIIDAQFFYADFRRLPKRCCTAQLLNEQTAYEIARKIFADKFKSFGFFLDELEMPTLFDEALHCLGSEFFSSFPTPRFVSQQIDAFFYNNLQNCELPILCQLRVNYDELLNSVFSIEESDGGDKNKENSINVSLSNPLKEDTIRQIVTQLFDPVLPNSAHFQQWCEHIVETTASCKSSKRKFGETEEESPLRQEFASEIQHDEVNEFYENEIV